VYGTQDVRDVINCLSAVDDPADEVAVVAALRSPAYACSDVDIVGFKLDGGRFDYLRADLDQRQGRVADGLRDLRTRHYGRHQGSLAAFVERFLTDRGLPEIGILDRGDRNSYRRTRFLVEQSRSFEAGGPESLRAFVSWLERRAGQAVLDNEGAGLDDDEDAVRVLTVHGSKGLEFPVVFLAGLGIGVGRDTRVFGMDRATREIGVAVGAKERRFTLGPVDSINMQEAQHLAAERDRLLYVAATRARDHLVVSLHHKVNANNSSDSAAARLISFGARDGAVALAAPAISPARRADPLRTLVVEDVGPPEEFDDRRAELVSGASNKHYVSATGLLAERDDDTEPWARGRGRHESTSGSTHVGRAVHATLQSIAWDAGDAEIAAMAKAQAVAEAIPQRQDEVARLVSRALATEAAGRARGARRALREVPFAMPARTTLVEGFADAVIETEDGAIEIIDWKTDDVTEAEVDERLAHYALQAGLYVLGLEAATLRTVSRITYVFVRPGVERSPGEPAPLALAARAHVEGGSVR
ncbi:MAG TPA: 3'-5' exonuclease, partial [Dehalococcoidia bacterium]